MSATFGHGSETGSHISFRTLPNLPIHLRVSTAALPLFEEGSQVRSRRWTYDSREKRITNWGTFYLIPLLLRFGWEQSRYGQRSRHVDEHVLPNREPEILTVRRAAAYVRRLCLLCLRLHLSRRRRGKEKKSVNLPCISASSSNSTKA